MEKYKNNQLMMLILIPIIMLFIAFIFDFVLMFVQDIRLEQTTKNIIKESFTYNVSDYYKKVSEGYEKNKITTDALEVSFEEEVLNIYCSYSYNSFFGNLIGKKSYRSEIHLIGYEKDGEIIIEEAQYE